MTIISDTCSREDGGPRLYTEKLMGAVGTAVNYQLITLDHDDEIPEHMKLSDTLKACNLKDTMVRKLPVSK